MSQEEARKLLDAWSFFDKHAEAKNWEGMPRAEFYRLVQIIAGTDNLVEAKEYFEALAAGTISGDMPTAILEAQKEGQNVSARLSTSKSATKVTRNWLAKLNIRGAEGVAEKQVAAAQVRAVVERAEEKVPKPEAPKPKAQEITPPQAEIPTEIPVETLATAPETGFGIKISGAAFEQLAGKATGAPLEVFSFFSPPKATATAQTQAAVASSLALSQVEQRAEKLPEADKARIMKLVENLRKAEFSFVLPVREMTILSGPEFGMSQGSIVALLGRGRGLPERGPSFFARVGQQLFGNVVQTAANKAISGALAKAGISVAGKTALKVGAKAAVGAAAGAAAGPPGWVVTLLSFAKDLLSKAAIWINKHKDWAYAALFAPVALAGVLLSIPALTAAGALGMGVSLLGGPSAAATSIGGFLGTTISALSSMVIGSIAVPLITALIGIPVVVVLILFIINSGAYLVPPRAGIAGGENPYINVEKTANPAGPFQNSDLSVSVEYTITITAKKGTLTNIGFDYKCEVIKKGASPACPPANLTDSSGKPVAIGPQANLRISPTEPYKLTYKASYSGATFQDSAILDTLTITADAPEQSGVKASGGAAVIIGKPPTGCFVFDGSWPGNFQSNEMQAIAELTGASAYMTKLCDAGEKEILLRYGGNNGAVGGDVFAGANIITLYSGGLQYGQTSTLYTLTHESGHIFARRYGGVYRQYADTKGLGDVLVCTYPLTNRPSESFAEMIADYVAGSPGHQKLNVFGCLGGGNFKTKYPAHWEFARNVIFQQALGW